MVGENVLPPANGRGASALCCLRGGISAPLRESAERSAPPLTTSQASAAGPPDRGADEEPSRGKPARKKIVRPGPACRRSARHGTAHDEKGISAAHPVSARLLLRRLS